MADERDDEPPVHVMALLLSKALTSLLGGTGYGFVLILTCERDNDPKWNDSAAVTNMLPALARETLNSAITELDRDPRAWALTTPPVVQ